MEFDKMVRKFQIDIEIATGKKMSFSKVTRMLVNSQGIGVIKFMIKKKKRKDPFSLFDD